MLAPTTSTLNWKPDRVSKVVRNNWRDTTYKSTDSEILVDGRELVGENRSTKWDGGHRNKTYLSIVVQLTKSNS